MTVNPLVAARIDQPASAWAGVWIAEDIELVGGRTSREAHGRSPDQEGS